MMRVVRRCLIIIFLVFCSANLASGQELQRTTLKVSNLFCSSCLNVIETELKKIPGMTGLTADLKTGTVAADHGSKITGQQVAKIISNLGYDAQVVAQDNINQKDAVFFSKKPFARCGTGGCNTGGSGCNATASAWKELYRRYFTSR